MPEKCGMHPIRKPIAPNTFQLQENGRRFPPNHLHHTWSDYLYWDIELENDNPDFQPVPKLSNATTPNYYRR